VSVAVGLGISELPFETSQGFWRWIEMCENSPVDSIWQTDRLITDNPMLESLSTMAAVAGATRRLKFGMNVIALGWRDPLVVAKQCASIDFLSGGRLLPAFGIGTPRGEEWDATGRDPKGRGARTDEALDIISRLWAGETVDYDGEYYRYRGARISPLPVQKRLPLWIGGQSKAAIRRTARIGTGWLAGFQSPEEVTPVVAAIKVAAEEVGRRIPEDHYGAGFHFRFGSWDDDVVAPRARSIVTRNARVPEDCMVIGDAADMVGRLKQFIAGGVTKFVVQPVAAGDDDTLDQTRRLIDEVLPEVPALNDLALA
jgi:probable F420-dependent oxidoreductase